MIGVNILGSNIFVIFGAHFNSLAAKILTLVAISLAVLVISSFIITRLIKLFVK